MERSVFFLVSFFISLSVFAQQVPEDVNLPAGCEVVQSFELDANNKMLQAECDEGSVSPKDFPNVPQGAVVLKASEQEVPESIKKDFDPELIHSVDIATKPEKTGYWQRWWEDVKQPSLLGKEGNKKEFINIFLSSHLLTFIVWVKFMASPLMLGHMKEVLVNPTQLAHVIPLVQSVFWQIASAALAFNIANHMKTYFRVLSYPKNFFKKFIMSGFVSMAMSFIWALPDNRMMLDKWPEVVRDAGATAVSAMMAETGVFAAMGALERSKIITPSELMKIKIVEGWMKNIFYVMMISPKEQAPYLFSTGAIGLGAMSIVGYGAFAGVYYFPKQSQWVINKMRNFIQGAKDSFLGRTLKKIGSFFVRKPKVGVNTSESTEIALPIPVCAALF